MSLRIALLALLVAAAAPLAGCRVDGLCVTCGTGGDGGSGDGGDPMDGLLDRDALLTDACLPSGVEVCDGIDNDCDLAIDEEPLGGTGVICGTDEGPCEPGRTVCEEGVLVCGQGAIAATAEACDGIDNDCDGTVDDGDPGGGVRCGISVGECLPGSTRCVDGALACEGGVAAVAELCNARDDDCDGVIDDGNPEGGVACGADVGTCAPGSLRCAGGGLVCDGAGIPSLEVCDGFDNDCDGGLPDEDFDLTTDPRHCGGCGNACAGVVLNARAQCVASTCVVETCDADFRNLDLDDEPTDVLGCEYACSFRGVEICNGVDDDCDGTIDEPADLTPPAICAQLGACVGTIARCDGDEGWVCEYPAEVQVDLLGGIVPETACDGEDTDCDGIVDDTFPELGQECDNGLLGSCRDPGVRICDPADPSRTICDVSAPPAAIAAGPQGETCNGLDDNCDGTVDDASGADRVIDDMVEINRAGQHFWIYRYEASRTDATAGAQGLGVGRSCAAPGVLPWTQVSYAAATAACAASGKRLCTGVEYGIACAGPGTDVYPYGDAFQADACNGEEHDGVAGGADDDVLGTTGRASCAGADGVYDLSGNAKEWTNDQRGTTGPPANTPIVVLRGGSYETPAPGLTCAFDLSRAPTTLIQPALGFRCCSSTAP